MSQIKHEPDSAQLPSSDVAKTSLLPEIHSPEDVRALRPEQIPALCRELREVMIRQTEEKGGHLASNLGVVELSVAIHRVFRAPEDHIIFDVGHQCYVHKLLTGRYEAFSTLRQPGGISGFPKRSESEYDAFGVGHASTSLSAALGFAQADKLQGRGSYTVVVLGDGAFTGGMIHEALNNCSKYLRLIVILNENEMSISKNVGRFAKNIAHLRATPGYFRTKSAMERGLEHTPLIGRPVLRVLRKWKRSLKNRLYNSNYFENMGFSYFGPADGNDEATVENLLQMAKEKGSSCLIHLKTVKGKGYEPAERTPDRYHCLPVSPPGRKTYSSVFGETLTALGEKDHRICALTAAMCQGTGLEPFRVRFPERFFDVGIAEEHAVTFAAGLAVAGMKPVVAIYSSFLQRSYDQILHDVVLQGLPVVFCVDRAGLNAADGATHHGIYDVSFLSPMPGLTLYEPWCFSHLEQYLTDALSGKEEGPVVIRYPAGEEIPALALHFYGPTGREVVPGVWIDFDPLCPPRRLAVTYGRIASRVLEAASRCCGECGVVLLEQLKPCRQAADCLVDWVAKGTVQRIVFCEEGVRSGGVGMLLASMLCDAQGADSTLKVPSMTVLAIDDFPVQRAGESIWEAAGLGVEDIRRALMK